MGFNSDVKEKALTASKRYCVICEKQKGKKIECHHIVPKAEGGEDSFDNCIPVCFDCHEEIGSYNSKHPKGNKFTASELRTRRDDFYQRISNGKLPSSDDTKKEESNKYDVALFDQIKAFFSVPNLKYYLTEYDLGNDFVKNAFSPLAEFYSKKDDPEYEFIDEELESYKAELFESINSFLCYEAINTFLTDIGTRAIRTWKNKDYSFEEALKINREFNDLASDVWKKYSVLVKACKKKLK